MHSLIYSAFRLIALACILYAAALVLTYMFQLKLQYHPNSTVEEPESVGLAAVQHLILSTPDGEKIMA